MIQQNSETQNIGACAVDAEKLNKHFKEIQHFYKTLQNDRGDKLFESVKKVFNLSYTEMNGLFKEYKKNNPG